MNVVWLLWRWWVSQFWHDMKTYFGSPLDVSVQEKATARTFSEYCNNIFPEVSMSIWRNSRRYVLGPSLHSAYVSNVRTSTRPHSWARPGLLIHPRSWWWWQLAEKLGLELGDSLWCWCRALSGAMIHAPIINTRFQAPFPTAVELLARFWVDGGWRYHSSLVYIQLHSEIVHP